MTPDPPHVRADQVSLRLVDAGDADRLAELVSTNREHLLSGGPIRDEDYYTPARQRAGVAALLAEHEAGRTLPLVVLLDGEVVGRITLSGIVRGALLSAALGYWVAKEAGGRGVATHAVRHIAQVAFGPLRLHRLQAEVPVGHAASEAVLRHVGFVEYGLAPRYLRLGGVWRDCRMYQLLAADDDES